VNGDYDLRHRCRLHSYPYMISHSRLHSKTFSSESRVSPTGENKTRRYCPEYFSLSDGIDTKLGRLLFGMLVAEKQWLER